MKLDYEASIKRLVAFVRTVHENEKLATGAGRRRPPSREKKALEVAGSYLPYFDPSHDRLKLQILADQLEKTLSLLEMPFYEFSLEDEFNADPDEYETDPATGWRQRVPVPPAYSRAGSYKALLWEIRRLIDASKKESDALPDKRKRAERLAAAGLLHVLYEADQDRPKLYDNGPAVVELERVLLEAGIALSRERIRGLLAEALENFQPCDGAFNHILVFCQ